MIGYMKKLYVLLLSTVLISGMSHAENGYIPVLYNLSTMFDFNPVKGPVKSLSTIVESNGKVTYKVLLKLNKKGCIESLSLDNISNGFKTELNNDGVNLVGKRGENPYFVGLTEDCNILSQNDNGEKNTFSLTVSGMIKDTYYLGQKIATHFYDDNDNLIRSEFYGSDKILSSNEVIYLDKNTKPLDYKIINESSYAQGYTATTTCKYNAKLVPELCNLIIQNAGNPLPKPTVITAHTSVEFY